MEVTNDNTRCRATAQYTVPYMQDPLPTPVATVSDITSCSPLNGEISVSLGGENVLDYIFMWYEGDFDPARGRPLPPDALASDEATLTGLSEGTYTYRFVSDITRCISELDRVDVAFAPSTLIAQQAVETSAARDCASDPTGEGEVQVIEPAGRTFRLQIYSGDLDSDTDFSVLTPLEQDLNVPAGSPRRFPLNAGIYTTRAQDLTSMCESVERLTISYVEAPALLNIVQVKDSDNCLPYLDVGGVAGAGGASGGVSLSLDVDEDSSHDKYQLYLYQGTRVSPTPDVENTAVWINRPLEVQVKPGIEDAAVQDVNEGGRDLKRRPYRFDSLAPGEYILIAAEEMLPNCYSAPLTFEVRNDIDPVTVSDVNIEPDTSCGLAGDGNGRIEVNEITIGATTYSTYGEFTFSWYSGNNPISSNILSGETGNEITDLFANSYTLRITKSGPPFSAGETGDTGVGCEDTFLYNIDSDPDNIRVASAIPTHVVSCSPPTGSIEVENIGIESVNEPF